jgi:hypothetical protein
MRDRQNTSRTEDWINFITHITFRYGILGHAFLVPVVLNWLRIVFLTLIAKSVTDKIQEGINIYEHPYACGRHWVLMVAFMTVLFTQHAPFLIFYADVIFVSQREATGGTEKYTLCE